MLVVTRSQVHPFPSWTLAPTGWAFYDDEDDSSLSAARQRKLYLHANPARICTRGRASPRNNTPPTLPGGVFCVSKMSSCMEASERVGGRFYSWTYHAAAPTLTPFANLGTAYDGGPVEAQLLFRVEGTRT